MLAITPICAKMPQNGQKRLDMLCHTVKGQKMPFDMFAQTPALHVTSISFSRAIASVPRCLREAMEMQLPYSDELEVQYLSRLFGNTSECYKFFWFQAIVTKARSKSVVFVWRK
ncbi:MAG: hypothetical protein LUE63_09830 [Lachnospiraceae bacterium]|nr:hypothetical protein [Lachnospiraceae bacterium]